MALRRRFGLRAAVLGVLLLAGCATAPTDPVGPARLPLSAAAQVWEPEVGWVALPAVPATAPTRRWSIDLAPGTEVLGEGSGVLVTAVAQGARTRVDRLDVATGEVLWSATVDGTDPDTPSLRGGGAPVVVLETSTAGSKPQVTVLDVADGRVILQALPGASPSVAQAPGLLLTRDVDGTRAFDRVSGAPRWRSPHQVLVSADGLLISDFSSAAGTAGVDGVADAATGAARWTQANPLFTDLALIGDTFVRTHDVEPGPDTVATFDAASGEPRWSATVDGIGRATVTPATPDLWVVTGGGPGLGSVGLSAVDGGIRWRVREALNDVVRLDSVPYGVARDPYGATVVDVATGAGRRIDLGGLGRLAGGALYTSPEPEVAAVGLLDGVELWRVPDVGDVYDLEPVPGGFTVVLGASEPRRLVAYLG